MSSTRVEIDLARIEQNGRILRQRYADKGVRITAVTKGVCGALPIAMAMFQSGIHSFGDSRLANLRRMRQSGIQAEFMLIRPPRPSEAEQVVSLADVSLNTEPAVVALLADCAARRNVTHQIILMVELGDLREGILPAQLDAAVKAVLPLEGIELIGIGTNLACLNGIIPTAEKMSRLSVEAERIEDTYGISLRVISGGNSANHEWLTSVQDVGRVNHLRIGEALLLGRETVHRRAISGLATDAFALVGEVIEVKTKPSRPFGQVGQDALGCPTTFMDVGPIRRAIVALGAQDIDPSATHPRVHGQVLGACSDELVLFDQDSSLSVGSEVKFDLGYSSLLRVMTSPYVQKVYSSAPHRDLQSDGSP
jgi:predicted amino acid racemase